MVEYSPYIIFGIGIGALVATVFWGKVVDRMILKFYDQQQELIRKFYGEMQEQSDRFFSIMETYIQKEDDNA